MDPRLVPFCTPNLMPTTFFCSGQGKSRLLNWVSERCTGMSMTQSLLPLESPSHVEPLLGDPRWPETSLYDSTHCIVFGNPLVFPPHWTVFLAHEFSVLFISYPHHTSQCLAHNKHSNIHWKNETKYGITHMTIIWLKFLFLSISLGREILKTQRCTWIIFLCSM